MRRGIPNTTAKQKLNSFHFNASLLIAGVIGMATGSWLIFAIVLGGLLMAGYHSGDIRR